MYTLKLQPLVYPSVMKCQPHLTNWCTSHVCEDKDHQGPQDRFMTSRGMEEHVQKLKIDENCIDSAGWDVAKTCSVLFNTLTCEYVSAKLISINYKTLYVQNISNQVFLRFFDVLKQIATDSPWFFDSANAPHLDRKPVEGSVPRRRFR